MAKLTWGNLEDRVYESGVSRGVLYPEGKPGVAWNGLVSVIEQKVGGEREPLYFDGIKYLDMISHRDYRAVVEAYSAPREFLSTLGYVEISKGFFLTRQPRTRFSFSYRNEINESDYKIHLVYNASVIPSVFRNGTLTNAPVPSMYTWTIDAVPNPETSFYPTAHLIIDSRRTPSGMLELLEHELYGDDTRDPYLPDKDYLISFLGNT